MLSFAKGRAAAVSFFLPPFGMGRPRCRHRIFRHSRKCRRTWFLKPCSRGSGNWAVRQPEYPPRETIPPSRTTWLLFGNGEQPFFCPSAHARPPFRVVPPICRIRNTCATYERYPAGSAPSASPPDFGCLAFPRGSLFLVCESDPSNPPRGEGRKIHGIFRGGGRGISRTRRSALSPGHFRPEPGTTAGTRGGDKLSSSHRSIAARRFVTFQ